jgi:hypothetical protein
MLGREGSGAPLYPRFMFERPMTPINSKTRAHQASDHVAIYADIKL